MAESRIEIPTHWRPTVIGTLFAAILFFLVWFAAIEPPRSPDDALAAMMPLWILTLVAGIRSYSLSRWLAWNWNALDRAAEVEDRMKLDIIGVLVAGVLMALASSALPAGPHLWISLILLLVTLGLVSANHDSSRLLVAAALERSHRRLETTDQVRVYVGRGKIRSRGSISIGPKFRYWDEDGRVHEWIPHNVEVRSPYHPASIPVRWALSWILVGSGILLGSAYSLSVCLVIPGLLLAMSAWTTWLTYEWLNRSGDE